MQDARLGAPRRRRRQSWRGAAAGGLLLCCARGASAQFLRGFGGAFGGGAGAGAAAGGGGGDGDTLPAGWCKNTQQGRRFVADDAGRACEWTGTDGKGCCATPLEACAGCDEASKCCAEFEFCVSCCQGSAEVAAGAWKGVPLAQGLADPVVTWPDAFDYCRGKCRTNPKSTVHENEYVSHSHHCFGDAAFPGATAPPPLAALPEGVVAVGAEERVSCSAACAESGLVCAPAAFAALNSCAWLRAAFPCEAGCAAGSGPELPAYMSGAVADASTLCRTESDAASPRTCDAAVANTRRLCPCGPA